MNNIGKALTLTASFFDDKVAAVRAATANADAPHFTPVPAGCVLNEFVPVTPADVVTLIKALPYRCA